MVDYKQLKKLVESRRKELNKLVGNKGQSLKKAPEGLLRVAKCKNSVQYFWRTSKDDSNGKYIKKKDMELVYRLAQKEYDLKVIDVAQKEIDILETLSELYSANTVETIVDVLPFGKADIITPVSITDAEYIKQWKNQKYERPNYYAENAKFDNGSGVLMRSKSEVLISHILNELKIPYLYEKPLHLSDYTSMLPDFTLLDIRTRQEVYLEHLGMMDDSNYIEHNHRKIKEYEKNGLYLGRKLLITYETSEEPLDIKMVRNMLKDYFK